MSWKSKFNFLRAALPTKPRQPTARKQTARSCLQGRVPRWLLLIEIKPAAARGSPDLCPLLTASPVPGNRNAPLVVSGNQEARWSVLSGEDPLGACVKSGPVGWLNTRRINRFSGSRLHHLGLTESWVMRPQGGLQSPSSHDDGFPGSGVLRIGSFIHPNSLG